jgi:hypothetical protein
VVVFDINLDSQAVQAISIGSRAVAANREGFLQAFVQQPSASLLRAVQGAASAR